MLFFLFVVCLVACLFACFRVCLAVCVFVCLFVYWTGWWFVCICVCFFVFWHLWNTFWCLSGTLGELLVTSLHFGGPGAPFGHPGVPFGHRLGPPGVHLGTLGVHFRSFLTLWGGALDPFGNFLVKGSKKVPEVIEKGTRNGTIFNDFLSLCGK